MPPAQVALAWVLGRPGVVAPLLGATRPDQVASNVAALDVALDPALRARLDEASAPPVPGPWFVNSGGNARAAFGATVERWGA